MQSLSDYLVAAKRLQDRMTRLYAQNAAQHPEVSAQGIGYVATPLDTAKMMQLIQYVKSRPTIERGVLGAAAQQRRDDTSFADRIGNILATAGGENATVGTKTAMAGTAYNADVLDKLNERTRQLLSPYVKSRIDPYWQG